MLGYRVGEFPATYLGHSLGVPHKLIKRLIMQKRKYLSKGGRFTLIKSMFSNLLIYFLSLFVIPIKVSLRLEPIQKDFLSGGGALEKKSHLVIWSTAYSKQKT